MAQRGAATAQPGPGEEDQLYPVAVLIDELKADELHVRVKATKQLQHIAEALGFQRTRDELVPFVTEAGGGWDDEDEVLICVAEQFGEFLPYVGGPEHCGVLLQPLEQLAAMEEAVVREKAVASIQNIAKDLPDAIVEREHWAMVLRLGKHDWATSRSSGSALIPALYSRSRSSRQQELRELWASLCGDDEPMVKRAVLHAMPELCRAVREPALVRKNVLEHFDKLAKDEQDGVRLLAIEKVVPMCSVLRDGSAGDQVAKCMLPLVRDNAVQDPSWRVRYMLTDNFTNIAQTVGLARSGLVELVSLYQRLAHDSEAEVRAAAAHQLSKLAPLFPGTHEAMKLLPVAQKLCLDDSQQVRAAAAGKVVSLSQALGRHETLSTLLPLLTQLLRDDNSEVRLNVIGELGKVSDVIGFAELNRHLLPAVVQLASDGKWRVREAVIKEVPSLAKQMGPDAFEQDLMKIVIGWMCDQVSDIRMLVGKVLCELVVAFGEQWFRDRLFPKLRELATKENYMHRFGFLQFLSLAAPKLSKQTLHTQLLPVLQSMSKDKVPNVRFNVAKATGAGISKLDASQISAGWRSLLDQLEQDNDPDVRDYAREACVLCP